MNQRIRQWISPEGRINPEGRLLKYNLSQCTHNTLSEPEFKMGIFPRATFIEAGRKIPIDLIDIGSGLQEET